METDGFEVIREGEDTTVIFPNREKKTLPNNMVFRFHDAEADENDPYLIETKELDNIHAVRAAIWLVSRK